ncbi:MAG: hypothetical protein E7168_02060 [Firmicutes bacterium]|nr:hypothetical protein [Bacillota bacterium]
MLKKIFLCLIICIFSFLILSSNVVVADSGFDSSWDSSYDYDYDYDYYYDYDSSYDYNWFDGDYYYSDYGFSSSGSYDTSSSINLFGFFELTMGICGMILVLYFVSIINTSVKGNYRKKTTITDYSLYAKSMSDEEIKYIDPTLTSESLTNMAFKIYKDVQTAWMNDTLDNVREMLSDELFNTYKIQLDQLRLKRQQNIMKDIRLVRGDVIGLRMIGSIETVEIKLQVNCSDYLVDKPSQTVLRGDDKAIQHYTYIIQFERNIHSDQVLECPNCGAPFENLKTTKCSYCRSIIFNQNTAWTMTRKTLKVQYVARRKGQ